VAGAPVQRRELVEQAGPRPDPVVLDPAADPRQLESVRWCQFADCEQPQHSETASAADEDNPEPRGTEPEISNRAPTSSQPAALSSATAPRAKARHPAANPARTGKRSSTARSGGDHLHGVAPVGVAVTVIPVAIANGNA
jgi:hypothetical protein